MAFMCIKGWGECIGCGECCFDEEAPEEEEYYPEDDWDEE